MSLTKNVRLSGGLTYAIAPAEAAAAEVAEGTFGTTNLAEALGLTEGFSELGQFVYSATAEGRTGEEPDESSAIDLDGEPGLIYSGPSGVAFNIGFENVDIAEGTIAPEATDKVTVALMINNSILAFADEGYVTEIDTEVAYEMNVANGTYAVLTEGDVVRLALIGGGEELTDIDVDVTGSLWIVG